MENAKLEMEGGTEKGIKAEGATDSEGEDRVEEKLGLKGQGQK